MWYYSTLRFSANRFMWWYSTLCFSANHFMWWYNTGFFSEPLYVMVQHSAFFGEPLYVILQHSTFFSEPLYVVFPLFICTFYILSLDCHWCRLVTPAVYLYGVRMEYMWDVKCSWYVRRLGLLQSRTGDFEGVLMCLESKELCVFTARTWRTFFANKKRIFMHLRGNFQFRKLLLHQPIEMHLNKKRWLGWNCANFCLRQRGSILYCSSGDFTVLQGIRGALNFVLIRL
jgi:hypothetical protein